jgi:hypothetical protein
MRPRLRSSGVMKPGEPSSLPTSSQLCRRNRPFRSYHDTSSDHHSCCLAFRRHSLLPHTQYVEDCASSLATDPQCPSDSLLIYWVKSMALAELVSLTFDHGSRERICELNDDKIQLLVKVLVRQLDEWKATLPPTNSTNGKWNPSRK